MKRDLIHIIFLVSFFIMDSFVFSWAGEIDKYTTTPLCLIEVPSDFTNIQEAIDEAIEGCEIIVFPGLYTENIELKGNNIILRSLDPEDPSIVETTIIDGNHTGPVITLDGDELTTCIIAGFTIINGAAGSGGGIDANGSQATIKYNIITQNAANTAGGGIYNCHGLIMNNIISENSALKYGGGISYCLGTIYNNTIRENTAPQGGGLYQCFGSIQNNLITFNRADNDGGGIYKCTGPIRNCFIAFNEAHGGAGLSDCTGILQCNTIYSNYNSGSSRGGIYKCKGLIINCIIWGNTNVNLESSSLPFFSCIQDWPGGGRGNISQDPKLSDPLNSDFHLLSDSPCIDSGNPYYLFGEYIADLDGDCRLAGVSIDMGCDEYGSKMDKDGDLLDDEEETLRDTDILNPDTDSDGLIDGIEILRGTVPTEVDEPSSITVMNSSIQEAVFLAFPMEEIVIYPAVYYENIHLLNKNIKLQGMNPNNAVIVESTILDGKDFFSVISFGGKEDLRCVIRGLTIQNGQSWQGGGIAGNSAFPLIEKNRIMNNSSLGDYAMGGGIHGCNGLIRKNIIYNNISMGTGASGGGLASCNGLIQENIISANQTERHGGGLVLCGFEGGIHKNIISNNQALYYGGGLSSCDTMLSNNIIHNNSANLLGGGIHAVSGKLIHNTIFGNHCEGEGGGLTSCSGIIRNSIIWDNTAPTNPQISISGPTACSIPSFSCIKDWTNWGNGNISSNPLLVDPALGDFHLLPSSPCLDAGGSEEDIFTDFEGDFRPFDSIQWETRGDGSDYDMGADEAVIPIPSPTPTPTPTPSPTPFVAVDYDFTVDTQGWTPHTITPQYTPARFGWLPGALYISSMDDNTVGYWDSPGEGIPLEQGYLYRSRFWLSTDVAERIRVPHIRLRTLSQNLQKADLLEISSGSSEEYSPTQIPMPYDLYFNAPLPSSGENPNEVRILLSFDLVNLNKEDASTGTVYLHRVLVERFNPSALKYLETIKYWDFESPKPSGWIWNEIAGIFTTPLHEEKKGGLFITGKDDRSYGFWATNPYPIPVKNNVLYRASYLIKTNEEDRSIVPGLRLRYNTTNWESAAGLEIYSTGTGNHSPTPEGMTYHHYYLPPQNQGGSPPTGIQLSFDLKSFDPNDNVTATVKLEQTVLDIFQIPD